MSNFNHFASGNLQRNKVGNIATGVGAGALIVGAIARNSYVGKAECIIGAISTAIGGSQLIQDQDESEVILREA